MKRNLFFILLFFSINSHGMESKGYAKIPIPAVKPGTLEVKNLTKLILHYSLTRLMIHKTGTAINEIHTGFLKMNEPLSIDSHATAEIGGVKQQIDPFFPPCLILRKTAGFNPKPPQTARIGADYDKFATLDHTGVYHIKADENEKLMIEKVSDNNNS